MGIELGIVIIARSQFFIERTKCVLGALQGPALTVRFVEPAQGPAASASRAPAASADAECPVLRSARTKAALFLESLPEPLRCTVFCASSFEGAYELAMGAKETVCIGVTSIERACVHSEPHTPGQLTPYLTSFYERLASSGVRTLRTSYSDSVWISQAEYEAVPYQSSPDYRVRVGSGDAWVIEAEMTVLFMNYVQHSFTSRLARKRLASPEPHVTLGEQLVGCMRAHFGEHWVLSYYTGSIVSSLINTAERLASDHGALVIRGPNEHSLACGAFIHARLYRRSYLIILTSSMIDELKGTLANLQQLGARGVIVCADAPESKWFGFQATTRSDADIRGVLSARKIPFVFLQQPEELAAGIERVARLLDTCDGPIVLLATQAVLESRMPLPEAPDVASRRPAARPEAEITIDSKLQDVLKIVNEGPERIFWQCGAVDADERDLILDIAHRAGIALGDSLSAPGFLPAYRDGRRVSNYLGMLGQYGTNQEVFQYLHLNGKLNRREEQCLFVLKGKLGQIDSPFSDAEHARRLHIVQINKNPAHIGPFADIGLAMPLIQFLRALRSNLSVKPDVLGRRERALAAVPRWIGDVSGAIPALPMTPNYFFAMLRSAVEKLITRHDYRYVGMFDVGHAGTMAVRYLPRTGPCHSGWYGRGLMGDPLQATGALVTSGGDPVIAVVGDGAKQLCPDILPSIVENLQATRTPIGKNVSIFYLVNNSLSIINSYQQRLMFKPGGRQMTVTNLEAFAEPDACAEVHGNRIVRKRLVQVSEEELVQELSAMNRINLFSVPVLSNDDWISIIDIGNWQCMRKRCDE